MTGQAGRKDQRDARMVAIGLIVLLVMLAAGVFLALPMLSAFSAAYLMPGLGLKDSAVIAFVVTVIVLIVFAIAAGDGLIGELQFLLGGFFTFFLVLWFLIAWVF